ncbi:bifunctional diguanylate cyclase/phosphodiesterase [Craterilacuibacter sp.]|uniref:bifunctional diguanylate cyclase/phosphodiesterase n=1 Tax=Craterilacuibacter sp. TaxID=2870909 RepID=UPI003F3683F2
MTRLSLSQRLWALLLLLVFLALSTSLTANLLGARNYLEQQLSAQNSNTANSLALMISQQQADPVMAETLINASFDQGHYHAIRWLSPDGRPRIERSKPSMDPEPSGWLPHLLPLAPAAGHANISKGWLQAGTLVVQADVAYAYAALERSMAYTLFGLLIAGLFTGAIGSLDIMRIRRQLDLVVGQAKAISERRFIHIKEPAIPELARVAQAMNQMVERLQGYLRSLSGEVEALRRLHDTDEVTGIANRMQLERKLQSLQNEENEDLHGQLLLLRVAGLAQMNSRIGGQRTDALLKRLAQDLSLAAAAHPGAQAARLRGADFALLCPELDHGDADALARQLLQQCMSYSQMGLCDQHDVAHIGLSGFSGKEQLDTILPRASHALAQAVAQAANSFCRLDDATLQASSELDWRLTIEQACLGQALRLHWYPVVDLHGRLLWQEGMLYLPATENTPQITALRLLSHSLRLGISHLPDLAALEQGLQQTLHKRIAINISPASLAHADFKDRVLALLDRASGIRVNFEFHETALPEHWLAFLAFSRAVSLRGHAVGVEIMGHDLALVARLGEAGIAYLELDSVLTQGIEHDNGRQAVIKGLLQMATLMEIHLLAKGLRDAKDAQKLASLGIHGMTGPAIGANLVTAVS